jgi:hypothetical protein
MATRLLHILQTALLCHLNCSASAPCFGQLSHMGSMVRLHWLCLVEWMVLTISMLVLDTALIV